jgi:NAD+ synthase (glutamine-hydrolysing)
MRIALAQINVTVGDIKINKEKILEYIREAKSKDADIIVFPELVLTGYPPEDLLLKKHFIIENRKQLKDLASQVDNILAIVGFVDIDQSGRLYNAAALLYQGVIKSVYYKNELPNYGVFDEKRYFTPGMHQDIFYFRGVPFGVTICEDIWVTGGSYLKEARQGAAFIINCSSSPYDLNKLELRQQLLKRRANEIQRPMCYVNLVGGQDELIFDGSSFAVDEQGRILTQAKEFEEDIAYFDLAIEPSTRINKQWIVIDKKIATRGKCQIKKEKEKALSPLERIYKALVLGTKDYVRKNSFKKVLIGLSGGIDSAVVAALAVEALGKESVVGVSMPSRFSSEGTRSDARQLAQNLGIEFHEISIEALYKSYLETLDVIFKETKSGLAEENIQARIRGNILMAMSNKFGWLVLTTGNKSEIAVGYCTLYGDMSGGYAVIKDVLKTKIYALAKLINTRNRVIPQSTIDRAPSAELRENQKDQDSLPPYDLLDQILVDYVEDHESFHQMTQKHNKDTVQKVINLVDKSEYKRRQAPPGVKVTARAFGKDWRLPITNKFKEF